jgi:hypothetical protein
MFCIEQFGDLSLKLCVPRSTDAQIDEIVEAIRRLCGQPFSSEAEADLRKLARELRVAIRNHVRMAKTSLEARRAVIDERDPEAPGKLGFECRHKQG